MITSQQKKLQDMFISEYVTLGNDWCDLCCKKIGDKLQEKLPCVTAPFEKSGYKQGLLESKEKVRVKVVT